jgi:hypothetical protein
MTTKINAPLHAETTAAAARTPWWMHAAFLLAILASNFFLRCYLDQADKHLNSFLAACYPEAFPEIYSLVWWQYLLPIKAIDGCWQATSVLTVHALEHWFGGPARVFYFTNVVLIVTSYTLSWHVFRSRVFTLTFTLCFAWSTFGHHVYINSGAIAFPLIVSYLLCLLFCQYKLMEPTCNYKVWTPLGFLAMLVYALAYESWLDCVSCMWVAYPLLIVLAYRAGDWRRVKAGAAILSMTTVTAIIYVVMQSQLGHRQGNGSESDVVMNYGMRRSLVGVEDVIAHWFTLVFIAITTYTPPFLFNGSMSSWRYGVDELISMQHGYHKHKTQLVGYSHVFLWRFYAGFALAAMLYGLLKSVRTCWRMPGTIAVAMALFLLMTLMPGTTHMLIKYRPMHSAPFLSYHSYFGIVGVTLLVSYALMWLYANLQRRWIAYVLILLFWTNLGYCALVRPAWLSHMAVQCGFAPYPDAWGNLKSMLR